VYAGLVAENTTPTKHMILHAWQTQEGSSLRLTAMPTRRLRDPNLK
jgi:hypothetical protein